MHHWFFRRREKRPGVKLPTRSHLVPSIRIRGAILPLPQYAFITWCLVKHRDNFSFTFMLLDRKRKEDVTQVERIFIVQ